MLLLTNDSKMLPVLAKIPMSLTPLTTQMMNSQHTILQLPPASLHINDSLDKKPSNSTEKFRGGRYCNYLQHMSKSTWQQLRRKPTHGWSGTAYNHSLKQKPSTSQQTLF